MIYPRPTLRYSGNFDALQMEERIAVFASGSGSNADLLMNHFADTEALSIGLIVCNKAGAGVIQKATAHNVPVLMTSNDDLLSGRTGKSLSDQGITGIVLAGFLLKIPSSLIDQYPDRIINIHPSLLPKYGGKGMYGDHVHRAVLANRESESGITIHIVNNEYDQGEVVAQFSCEVHSDDDVAQLRKRVQKLEHRHYSRVAESYFRML